MPVSDIFSYFVTFFAIAAAPGPLMLILLTRATASDVKGSIGFAFGATLGSVLIISAVCLGLSAWFADNPDALWFSKYLMLAYMLWIARDVWRGGFNMRQSAQPQNTGIVKAVGAGLITCFLSPYMMVLLPLVLPEVLNISTITLPSYLIVALVTFFAWAMIAALVIGLATQLRRLARSDHATTIMNRSLAFVLALGGGWMAFT
jgi:threonine/homoserine/homoserine lactone efflux protein